MENDIDPVIKEEIEKLKVKHTEALDEYFEVENEERRLNGLALSINKDIE